MREDGEAHGLESLARHEAKKPRSMSQKGNKGNRDSNLFSDTESDILSALNPTQSESSAFNSRDGSPDPYDRLMASPDVKERDVDDE